LASKGGVWLIIASLANLPRQIQILYQFYIHLVIAQWCHRQMTTATARAPPHPAFTKPPEKKFYRTKSEVVLAAKLSLAEVLFPETTRVDKNKEEGWHLLDITFRDLLTPHA
jgi:hypothetical protein